MFTYKIPDELLEQVNKYREEYENSTSYAEITEVASKLGYLIDTEFPDKECIIGVRTTYRPSASCILDTEGNILTESSILEYEDLYDYLSSAEVNTITNV